MRLVVFGLSLSSSWGNGHATTYRSLLKAFAARGHDIVFFERNVPWYSGQARDLADPSFCRLVFYENLKDLDRHRADIAAADAVMVGSYVPDGIALGAWVREVAQGTTAFYDIDTPVTLAALENGTCAYLDAASIPAYDHYLSFTGGPILDHLRDHYGSPDPRALYCCVDPTHYGPRAEPKRWDLSYLGTYSDDRQPVLERLLLDPARRAPYLRFVVAGPQYPATIDWPANVERFEHVGPQDHAEFYGASRFTLNVTRDQMVKWGYSPSVRLFEAGACATPIISDIWPGIETVLTPGESIILAASGDDVLPVLAMDDDAARQAIGTSARGEILARHTAAARAAELDAILQHGGTSPSKRVAST
ncbi:CgeB family protein [Lichenihabitans psoromatis]|uniref:CgeB family protein n=1 Tax=Lichenihabitans psoromatis TaxID=2528642 RepID=UPI0010383098|nr:glycosyltransferase [Lichenihabitans psoromatis]